MFGNLIKEIWSTTPGLENVILSGVDGIVIVRHHDSDFDDILVAEAANLIKESQRFGNEMESGSLKYLCSQYDDMILAIQMVTADYFLLGLLRDPKHLGMVRYRFTLKAYEWYSAIA